MSIFGNGLSEDTPIRKKEKEYRDELNSHYDEYKKTFTTCFDKIKEMIPPEEIQELIDNMRNHDKTKFSEKEFNAYRQWKHPMDGERKDKDKYELALLHHIHNNTHHIEAFVLIDGNKVKPLRIPLMYIIEIALDLITEGREEGKTGTEIFDEMKDKVLIHPESKKDLIAVIKTFDELM